MQRPGITYLLPFMGWMRRYRREWVRPDLSAGLTIAFIAVPQSIAFAMIAGLPAEYGIYAAIFPCIMGAFFGSSAHLMNGPTNAISLVVLTSLAPLVQQGYGLDAVLLLSFLVGLIQLVMGIARMGLVVDFISNAVLMGFTAGVAVQIIVQQIKHALGLDLPPGGYFYNVIWHNIKNVPEANPLAVGLAVSSIIVLLILERYFRRWPSALVVMVLTGLAVFGFNQFGFGTPVVGALDGGLPPLSLPLFDMELVQRLMPAATAIALLGLLNSLSISKTIALKSRQIVDNNQEFIGQGVANLAAAFTTSMPVAGSFNRSMANYQAGAKTAMSAVFCGLGVVVISWLFGTSAAYLPLAAIAGILFVTAIRMIDVEQIKLNLMATRGDAATMIVTFMATLFLSLEFAVYVGMFLSITMYLMRTSHPQVTPLLPEKPGSKLQPDVKDTPCPQMSVVAVDGSLFFGSSAAVQSSLDRYLDNHPQMQNFVLRMHHVDVLDASGIHTLRAIHDKLKSRGGTLALAGLSRINAEVLANSGFMEQLGEEYVRKNTSRTMEEVMKTFSRKRCYNCPYTHFKECRTLKREGRKLENKS